MGKLRVVLVCSTLTLAAAQLVGQVPLVVQQAYLKPSFIQSGDEFGGAVAVSGNTIVVGAPGNNQLGADSGAVSVFVRSDTGWSQQAFLQASNVGQEDAFGTSVAISGDTIVVGAPGEDSNATGVDGSQVNGGAVNSGAAYVFVRSGTEWSQYKRLRGHWVRASRWLARVAVRQQDLLVLWSLGARPAAG